MNRILRLALLVAMLTPAVAVAQGSPPLVKYGKWGLLATSIGLNLLSAAAHDDADAAFDALESRCREQPSVCIVSGGNYLDPESERLFQETLSHDRRSRRWLIAGQTALLGAAAMFVWEFTRPSGTPDDNIPFGPRVQELRDGVGLGVELRF